MSLHRGPVGPFSSHKPSRLWWKWFDMQVQQVKEGACLLADVHFLLQVLEGVLKE